MNMQSLIFTRAMRDRHALLNAEQRTHATLVLLVKLVECTNDVGYSERG